MKKARQYGRPDVLSGQDIRGSLSLEDLAPFFLRLPSSPFAGTISLARFSPHGVFSNETSFAGESYVLEDIGYVTRRKGKLDFLGGTRARVLSPVDWMNRAIPTDTKSIESRFRDRA